MCKRNKPSFLFATLLIFAVEQCQKWRKTVDKRRVWLSAVNAVIFYDERSTKMTANALAHWCQIRK